MTLDEKLPPIPGHSQLTGGDRLIPPRSAGSGRALRERHGLEDTRALSDRARSPDGGDRPRFPVEARRREPLPHPPATQLHVRDRRDAVRVTQAERGVVLHIQRNGTDIPTGDFRDIDS
jgi:hypothetical protein